MIRIVTDSGANLPRDIVEEFQIESLPASITFDGETIRETDLTSAEFYRRLATSKSLPMARDASVKDFTDVYAKVAAESPNATILSIHVAETLATTISAARQAAAMRASTAIRLFDTQSVSFGQGLMVWEAARMAKADASVADILTRLAIMRERTQVFFLVDTLEYLAKGGRVGPVARLVGGLLSVKPILTVKEGTVVSHSQYRTRARAMAELTQYTLAKCEGADGLRMGVMHAICEEDAQQMADEFRKKLQPEALTIAEIGPAVGASTGPKAIGVTWFAPPKNAS